MWPSSHRLAKQESKVSNPQLGRGCIRASAVVGFDPIVGPCNELKDNLRIHYLCWTFERIYILLDGGGHITEGRYGASSTGRGFELEAASESRSCVDDE